MIKSVKRSFLMTAILFFSLIAFYYFAMSAVYFIPSEKLQENFEEGAAIIYEEGEYYQPFFDNISARLDGTTDIIMMSETIQRLEPGMSPFKASMYINGYQRFWHGYQIFLRPALAFMTYRQIRYFNTFIFFILMCLAFSSIKKHISTLTAICFVISLMMAFSFLAPMNMQYMAAYTVSFLSIIVMLKYKDNFRTIYLLFFVTGSVINFLDFLTFPLLTFGLPFAALFFAREKTSETKIWEKLIEIIKCSVMWGMGYALTWVAKWTLGTIITGQNVFFNAAQDAAYRMFGNENWPLDRKFMYWVNLFKFLTPENIFIALMLTAALLVLVILSRRPVKRFLSPIPIILVAAYPYIWYFVFANHSQFHSFFTYRSQIFSAFIGLAYLANAVDFQRVKTLLTKVFKKKNKKALSKQGAGDS